VAYAIGFLYAMCHLDGIGAAAVTAPRTTVTVGDATLGNDRPFTLIAGLNVLEGREVALRVAERLRDEAARRNVPLVFKASYDKANRSSHDSFRGPGLDVGLRWLAEIRREVGVPVVTTIFPDYASCVAALARGDLDVAQLSPFAFVQAEAQIDDLLPLASSVAQGSMTYGSYLVSRRGSKITTWKDVKGKRVGFIDRLSTSGYLYPRIFLEEKGIDLDRDLASITFYGQHDRALN